MKKTLRCLTFILCFISFIHAQESETEIEAGWGEDTFTKVNSFQWSYFNDPHIYLPLAAALALVITDQDGKISDWASDNRPIFGSVDNARSVSDSLAFYVMGSQLILSGLLTSNGDNKFSGWSKFKGISASLIAVTSSFIANEALKDGSGRIRPDFSDSKSFPSGHTSIAASMAFIANENYKYANLDPVQEEILSFVNFSIVGTVAWARVEARRHHLSDVFAGYALGRLVTKIVYHSFIEPKGGVNLQANITPETQGISLTYSF